MGTIKIGIVGVGAISGIYLENITKMFQEIEIVGVCDLIASRAENAAKQYNISKVYRDMYALFEDPTVDIVLNLTRPYEHFGVTMAALQAGKHVYTEKPLAASLEEGIAIMQLAEEKGLHVGGAPDTFMGAGIQTCRKIIEEGGIGSLVGAAGFMICRGHENWHPDPDFYYQYGGGPMMDMGPYYLTAMVNLLGEVSAVQAMGKISFAERTITSKPHYGETIRVRVPTYLTGNILFSNGAIGTLFTTFDVHYPGQARLEVYGSEGTLYVPDPNGFGGPVQLYRPDTGMQEIPLAFPYAQNCRALGLADMAKGIQNNRAYRANAQQIFHVLEIMEKFMFSSRQQKTLPLQSQYRPSKAMVNGLPTGILDAY